MGPGIVSLLFTVGASTWIYTKLQKTSGNNTKQTVIAVAVAAVFMFIVVYYIFSLILK